MSDYQMTSNELAELFSACSPKILSICVVIDCTDDVTGTTGSRVIAIQKDTIKTFLKQIGNHISGDKYKHQKAYIKNRYANDEEFRQAKIIDNRERYRERLKTNPGWLAEQNEKGKIHPTQKPVQLYKWLLTNYAKQGDKILDTHLGSDSIAIACHELGFDLTACEIDKDYFEKSMKRLNDFKLQTKLL